MSGITYSQVFFLTTDILLAQLFAECTITISGKQKVRTHTQLHTILYTVPTSCCMHTDEHSPRVLGCVCVCVRMAFKRRTSNS